MRRLFFALLVTAGLLPLALGGQVVIQEIGALQETFSKAQDSYHAFKFPQALQLLNPLDDTLTKWEQTGRLQPSDETLLERVLELKGVCAYNLGQLDDAKQDFTRLIQLRPEYPFSVTRSPKIQKFFEDVRTSLTGTLALSVDPEDSVVTVDGRQLGTGYPRSFPVLKGLHVLRVTHPGYTSQEQEVNVEIGTTVPVNIRLVPNARSIYFFVQPQGTQLLIDGKPAGRAEKTASAQQDWAQFASENKVDPGSVYVIPALYLPPGEHKVTLLHQCYLTRDFLMTVTLDKVRNSVGFIRPITLEQRSVNLEIASHPTGAQVTLDGQQAGITPLSLQNFCIGEHDLLVQKAGVGEYRAKLDIPDQSPYRVMAVLRPTLLWIGLTRVQDVTPDQLQGLQGKMNEAVGTMKLFNTVLSKEKNPMLSDTFFVPGVDPQEVSATVQELCEKYKCQGLLAGKLAPAGSSQGAAARVTLRLFVPGIPGYDEFSSVLGPHEEAASALESVDRPLIHPSAEEVVSVADLPGAPGPTFVRGVGDPSGPSPGDVLLGVDTTLTPTVAAASKALAGDRNPTIRYLHKGQEETWHFRADQAFVVQVYGGSSFPYRRLWLLSRQAVLGAESTFEKRPAVLNLACADLNLGRPDQALKDLDMLGAESSGEPAGAAWSYLRAVALIQLNRVEEARPLLLSAAGDPSASLDGLGDILVQPLATDLLQQLPPPPPPPLPVPKPEH